MNTDERVAQLLAAVGGVDGIAERVDPAAALAAADILYPEGDDK